MNYREEVEQALECVNAAVERYVAASTSIPGTGRKAVAEAFVTVTCAAESSYRYAERMVLLERRWAAMRAIGDGADEVKVEPFGRKDLVVVMHVDDARFLVRDLRGESKLVSKPTLMARDAVELALKEHEGR